MGGQHKGNFAAKHGPEIEADPAVADALKSKVKDGRVSCAAAHHLARDLKVSPALVGVALDLARYRINKCQLGLFGYWPEKRIVKPALHVAPELEKAIRAALKNSRLSCSDAWELAEKSGLSRLEVAAACEALQIRISSCQLGAF
ncbi:MAG: hypothetical protein R2941_05945 [Desulfobacterales bacterium]